MSDSRFNVLAQPTAAPGHCYVTGETGADHGPYIDTRINIRPNSPKGAFYLSANAVREMYRELCEFEGIDPELKYTEFDLAEAKAQEYDKGHRDGVEEVLETFNEFVSSRNIAGGTLVAESSSGVQPEDVSEDTGESNGSSTSADDATAKSSSSSGRKGHRGVSGDDVLNDGDLGLKL